MSRLNFLRSWRLSVAASVAAAGLVGCGGGSTNSAPPISTNSAALVAAQPGEVLAFVKGKLPARLAQAKLTGTLPLATAGGQTLSLATNATGDQSLHSGTTVQEAGVDEEDLIKSDGSLLYSLDTYSVPGGARLVAQRRQGDGRLTAAAQLDVPSNATPWSVQRGLLLASSARRIAVLSENIGLVPGGGVCPVIALCAQTNALTPYGITSSSVNVQVVDAPASGSLTAGDRLSISGRLVGTRLLNNTLVLVSSYSPQLPVETLATIAGDAERQALIDKMKAADVLPTISINGGPAQALVTEAACYVQPNNASLAVEITTVTTIDLNSTALDRQSTCIAGGTEAIYMSPQSLVLATTRVSYTTDALNGFVYPSAMSTDLHKFSLTATGVSYRASGTVAGHLGWDTQRKPYRISESGSDIRVLSFTGSTGWLLPTDAGKTAPSPATLTVLRERSADASLQTLATLPNKQRPDAIGDPNEQVYGVRFFENRAYVVTFRQVDPLYVIDLSDPADPKVVGALKTTGFSDYLYPLANGLLLGVGKQANEQGFVAGVKVALFDVSDATQPRELSSTVIGGLGASSALDSTSHGINFLTNGSLTRIALPVAVMEGTNSPTWSAALQRFEVNSAARTLTSKPALSAPAAANGFDLWAQRSLQIGNQIYYLAQGTINTWDW